MEKIIRNINEIICYLIQNGFSKRDFTDQEYEKLIYSLLDNKIKFSFNISDVTISEKVHLKNIDILFKYLFLKNGDRKKSIDLISSFLGNLIHENDFFNEKSLDFLYKVGVASFYIKDLWKKNNIDFTFKSKNGPLEISINKSKPELINFNVENENINDINSPKCSICYENINNKGTNGSFNKENLRSKDISLNGEKWFMQFSPYSYLEKHLIVINYKHIDMKIDKDIIKRFVDFLDLNPRYFIGSNAGKEIIGGSMRKHNHYQSGIHILPITKAKSYNSKSISKNIKISHLKWPVASLLLESKSQEELSSAFRKLFFKWKNFNTKNIPNIKGKNNDFSILSIKKGELYKVWIIFRNNYTDRDHLTGLFGINKKRTNIKKESIGLIEVAGRAILPGRIQKEIEKMLILRKENKINVIKNDEKLFHHYKWLESYTSKKDLTFESIKPFIGNSFNEILNDVNPWKSKNNFEKFIDSIFSKDNNL